MKDKTFWVMGVSIFAVLWTAGIGWIASSWIVMIWAWLGFVIASGAVWWIKASERRKLLAKEKLWLSESLDYIHRSRHDWLNQLQLLYGYVRLNKYDKLPAFVESLKRSLQQESSLTLIKSDPIEWVLLRQCISGNTLKLDVRVDSEWNVNQWLVDEMTTAKIIHDWLETLKRGFASEQLLEVNVQFTQQEGKMAIVFEHAEMINDRKGTHDVESFMRSWPQIQAQHELHTSGFRLQLIAREN